MKPRVKIWAVFAIFFVGLMLVGVWLIHPVRAAGPWYVAPSGNDGDDCLSSATPCETINGAIGKATAGDIVYVAIGTYTGAGDQVVFVDKDITLSGGWNLAFTVQAGKSTIEGNGVGRCIWVSDFGLTVIIEHFIIQNGITGIYTNGNLHLDHSHVTDNGSLQFGGTGIYSSGILTITHSVVSGTGSDAGGIYVGEKSTIRNSSINNNTGPGIYVGGGMVNIINSTISGNAGGGIYARVEWGEFTLNLYNATISGNTSSQGGGLNVFGGSVNLQNSIIANNQNADDTNSPDCYGVIGSVGYNLIGNATGCTFNATTGDLLNLDPRLFLLSGSPGYHPLFPNSLAIDAGNPAGCTDHAGSLLDTDQRGVARVGRCDIGAYEFDPDNNPISSVYLPLIRRDSAGLNGRVTLNGAPIAGVFLELHFLDGSSDSILATTTTGADGRYVFRNMPGLAPNQKYYVLYQNTQGTPGLLLNWETGRVTSYIAGGEVAIGDFDIADVVLVSPEGGALVSIPATFQWTPRPASPTDNYEFDLFDPDDFAPYFTAPSLGYVGSFTLDYLPDGFDTNTDYAWGIAIFGPDGGLGFGGVGFSSTTRLVRFSDSGSMQMPE